MAMLNCVYRKIIAGKVVESDYDLKIKEFEKQFLLKVFENKEAMELLKKDSSCTEKEWIDRFPQVLKNEYVTKNAVNEMHMPAFGHG